MADDQAPKVYIGNPPGPPFVPAGDASLPAPWLLYMTPPDERGWHHLKLIAGTGAKYKANYKLKWSRRRRRLNKCPDRTLLKKYRPEVFAQLRAYLEGLHVRSLPNLGRKDYDVPQN